MTQQQTERTGRFNANSTGVVLDRVSKIFYQPDTGKPFSAVDNVSLQVESGELVTLLGPSGCGKTTTLRMISGFEYPTEGTVRIGDRDMTRVPPNRRNISMVFQSYALFPHMNIRENVAYGLTLQKLSKAEIKRRTEAVMDLMHLTGFENRFPNQLSGGQQQRVALARAVVIEPGVLLFDEPLSNLDAKLRETMRAELRQLQQRLGITSLYVTHDQEEAMAISDRIVLMKDGRIEQMGTPAEIYEYPRTPFVAHFIGKTNLVPAYFRNRVGDAVAVCLGDAVLELPRPGRLPDPEETRLLLSIRPESVRLSAREGQISARLLKQTYFGSYLECVLQLEETDKPLLVHVYNPAQQERFADGTTVFLQLDLDSVRVLREESAFA